MEKIVDSKKMEELRAEALRNANRNPKVIVKKEKVKLPSTLDENWGKTIKKSTKTEKYIQKEVEMQTMEALSKLSEVNLKVAEVKKSLDKLKQSEATYFAEREASAIKKIDAVLQKSTNAIALVLKNIQSINNLHTEATSTAKFLLEAQSEFRKLVDVFDETSNKRDEKIKEKEKEVTEILVNLAQQQEDINKEKEQVSAAQKEILEDKKRIRDENSRLARIVERLKNNRI